MRGEAPPFNDKRLLINDPCVINASGVILCGVGVNPHTLLHLPRNVNPFIIHRLRGIIRVKYKYHPGMIITEVITTTIPTYEGEQIPPEPPVYLGEVGKIYWDLSMWSYYECLDEDGFEDERFDVLEVWVVNGRLLGRLLYIKLYTKPARYKWFTKVAGGCWKEINSGVVEGWRPHELRPYEHSEA